ncbi:MULTISPECIES: MAPEG family protein [Sphingomonadales]|uniref:GST-like protein n=2 Tax=Edaphosphingomonas TaxID=3423724 RepID=A0A2T4I077_9SPHN|nr:MULTISPECIES: MAPEG family protein [Sphingomonas]AGH50097.1 GST-related protein [Sphingomonas sp. MM-1]MDX3883041.1 MAPEG family protein [Sphingomonas sp.]OHT18456.1 MAPEG family protein [Sphingomonas haloaromaticamans]PTD22124.1 GST-like protein [Sphingomonas fennica]
MTILPITLTFAAAATIINLWLGFRVSQIRTSAKVLTGDGGNPLLLARMRAHANYTEYTPFFLILVGLIELARGSQLWLSILAAAFVVGRILHAFGMDSVDKPAKGRIIGILVTWLVLIGLAGWALVIAYLGMPTPVTADMVAG